jgi:multidrug efflux pump
LLKWVPRAVERVKTVPGVVDVSTDREQGGFPAQRLDRPAGRPRGSAVRVQDIDAALANAYAQRQVSTI